MHEIQQRFISAMIRRGLSTATVADFPRLNALYKEFHAELFESYGMTPVQANEFLHDTYRAAASGTFRMPRLLSGDERSLIRRIIDRHREVLTRLKNR